jgi:GNAT superfamily N-acetyltransferase
MWLASRTCACEVLGLEAMHMSNRETLSPVTPTDVARLEEGRLAKVLADVSLEHAPFAGGVCGFGGPGSWQNGAYGAGLSGPVDDAEIDRFCAFYRERGVEPRIELAPVAHETLVRGLAERGFVIQDFENVLYRELRDGDDYRAALPHGWPATASGEPLSIRAVDAHDERELLVYTQVSGSGFRPEGAPVNEVELATARRSFRTPYCEIFLASFGEEPAAGAAIERHGPLVCLFGMSTLPAHRHRGVQLALLAHRLERARALGAGIATIGSKPGVATERNAARMGFHVAYTKVILRKPEPGLEPSP